MESEYKAQTRFTTSISKKLYLSNAFFLKQKTLLRHKICGLIQTDTWMVGEEDRDRGLMNTQTSSPCVCQPPIATEWDQISRPSAFHT